MNLLKPLVSMSSMIIFSRISGFVRDIFIASFFGSVAATDSFFVAFKLPNLLRRIFAEGVFSQAFIPILVEYKNQQDNEASRIFISYVSGLLVLILTIVTLIGIFAAPWIIYITAPGFINTLNKFNLTVRLLRITFPYILLISLVSLGGAILNTWNYFSVPAFTPALLNISIIVSITLSTYFKPPIIALAWGIFFGGILQLLYQLPYLQKISMLVLPRISLYNKEVWQVIKLMCPAIIGVSINQISLIINTIFASFLQSGSISWIYYADRLMEFPTTILGVTISTILLPSLTKSFSTGDYYQYRYLIDKGLRLCFLLALPCTISLAILAKPLIVSLFQYKNFTSYDTVMTQKALISYCFGLMGFIMVKILTTVFYSRQDIKTPVIISITSLVLTQLMNLIFIDLLKHAGLTLSISLAACFNALMLHWQLRRQEIFIPLEGWKNFLFKLFIALIVMTTVLLLILNFVPTWENSSMLTRIISLLIVIFVGAISYFAMLFILGFRLRNFFRLTNN